MPYNMINRANISFFVFKWSW